MKIDELDYELPEGLVAKFPTERRDASRLMVLRGKERSHRGVADLPEILAPGSLLVVNDTRVLPARLLGTKATGGKVEFLLLECMDTAETMQRWRAMGRANRPIRAGVEVTFGAHELRAIVESSQKGQIVVRLEGPNVSECLEEVGHVPLPPYLNRADMPSDRERYQTVYARVPGAVAAPTAGLHFSDELLQRLEGCGVRRAHITLHVGPGTFRPVTADTLDEHEMHSEQVHVSEETVAAIEEARAAGGKVVAVGTTVVRALESAARSGKIMPMYGETDLMIQPGYSFRVVDQMLTNFHLPRSTLLALVFAFGGTEQVRQAYRDAIEQSYRFYSYGDAMFLERRYP